MASAWGSYWGSSWGDVWGALGGVVTLLPPPVENTNVFYAATISQFLAPELYNNAPTFYAATVVRGPVELLAPFFENEQTFYVPVVSPGAVVLSATRYDNTQTFYAPTIVYNVSAALYSNAQTFYAPTVLRGPVTLLAERFDNVQTFYQVNVRLDELVILSGVSATTSVGTPTFSLDCKFVVVGNVITSFNGDVAVTTTVFPYDADAYDRSRVVYVETKTSADARVVVVGEQPRVVFVETSADAHVVVVGEQSRVVFVEARPTVFERRANVDDVNTRTYVSRRSTSAERTARV